MIKKEMLILLFFAVIFSSYISAQETTNPIEQAYSCLDSLVNRTSLSLEEAVFSSLAGTQSAKIAATINATKSPPESCWPNSGCKVKDTALVALAKKHAGEQTTNITNWLVSKNGTPTELDWYLQITINDGEIAQCKVNYDGSDYNLQIGADMKVSGSPGNCLSITSSGYRLQVVNQCLSKAISVTCTKGFKTNLLYEKRGGGVLYVSSQTHSAIENAWTTEKINALCFKDGVECNYEASLWATTALYDNGLDVSAYVPYLIVLAENNGRFFPSAFLKYIEGSSRHYEEIINNKVLRPQSRFYWEESGNKFYDGALAMVALGRCASSGREICTNADLKGFSDYLLDVQDESGCWNNNNLRDTAFLLYSGWPRILQVAEPPPVGGGGIPLNDTAPSSNITGSGIVGQDPSVIVACEDSGYFCAVSRLKCEEAGGQSLPEDIYACLSYSDVCCTVQASEDNCASLGGNICRFDEICRGSIVSSSEGACCLDICESISIPTDGATGGGETPAQPTVTEKSSRIWIIILIILIILVVLGIIFRNKLRVWWFSFRGRASSSKIEQKSYGETPRFTPRPMPRFAIPTQRAPPQSSYKPNRTARGGADKEMEETLAKLKKISE